MRHVPPAAPLDEHAAVEPLPVIPGLVRGAIVTCLLRGVVQAAWLPVPLDACLAWSVEALRAMDRAHGGEDANASTEETLGVACSCV